MDTNEVEKHYFKNTEVNYLRKTEFLPNNINLFLPLETVLYNVSVEHFSDILNQLFLDGETGRNIINLSTSLRIGNHYAEQLNETRDWFDRIALSENAMLPKIKYHSGEKIVAKNNFLKKGEFLKKTKHLPNNKILLFGVEERINMIIRKLNEHYDNEGVWKQFIAQISNWVTVRAESPNKGSFLDLYAQKQNGVNNL